MINKKKLFLVSLIFFTLTISIQIISALTANSSSYSVGMFGTGMAIATPSSTNYSSTSLSEYGGTTRGGSNELYTVNIGFFDDASYHRTVSITSYIIYPTSAVQGSIIRLSISALNAQSTWAVLTLPNNTQETIQLNNNGDTYYTVSSVGIYTITFYANSSSGSLASAIDTLEITSPTQDTTSPSGGGGDTTILIENCTYIWDCNSWSICSNKNQTRKCENIGTCEGIEGKPIEERICSDALFDVSLRLEDLVITENSTLKFNVSLIEQKGIENIDVQIRYSIIDKYNEEIFSQVETRAIKGKLDYEKELKELELINGDYLLRVDILYGDLQRAFAEQSFEIKRGELEIKGIKKDRNILWVILGNLIFITLLISFILTIKIRKRRIYVVYKNKLKKGLKKISPKKLLMIFIGFALIVLLLTKGKNIVGVVGTLLLNKDYLNVLGFVLIMGILGLFIFAYWKEIVEKIGMMKRNKYSKESLKGLIKKRVYTGSGYYVGKVKEVVLGENKIDSLRIKLEKKKCLNAKGIIIRYKNVRSIGHVVIIEDKILNKIKSLKS